MNMKHFSSKWNCLVCARWLVIAELVSLFVSTSLTSVVEILLFVSVLCSWRNIRERAALLLRQPAVAMALLFSGVLLLGLCYGPAPFAEKLAVLKGWRKLLLLPLAVLLFDEPRWKQRLTWVLILVAAGAMLRSYAGFLGGGPTIVVHNQATQGMFFAVAAFAALGMMFSVSFSRIPARVARLALFGVAMLLIANVVFVNTGRSGYLALLVLSLAAGGFLFQGWFRIGLVLFALGTIAVLLFVSPVAKERIVIAINDMRNHEQAEQYSDMGIRMVMWKNTLQIIKERPWIGHGLGGFKEAYRQQVVGIEGWRGIEVDDPHNQYLKVAAEHGIVGLLVFLGLIGSFFRHKVLVPYRLLGLGALLAWCATSFFSGHFSTWSEGRFILLWAGAQLAGGGAATKESG
ncbi:MAG: O-antigen ligase family protein [Thermodesulfobacteriota bacterium]